MCRFGQSTFPPLSSIENPYDSGEWSPVDLILNVRRVRFPVLFEFLIPIVFFKQPSAFSFLNTSHLRG